MTPSPKTLTIPLLLLSACIVSNPYEGGDTFDTLSTTSEGMTGTGESGSASGDGDGDPATGDGDGDPTTTTGDGDGDPTTTGDGDGDPTTTTGDGDGDGDPITTGDGDGDPPACERRRWRYDFDDDSWTSVALDSVWAGANAPPCDVEIWGAAYIEDFDQLHVFAANGMYYRQQDNSWAAPEPITDSFPQLANEEIESIVQVPVTNGNTGQIVINSLPNAYFYDITANGDVTHSDTLQIQDEPPPGPPQTDVVRTWSLSFGDGDLLGDAVWWGTWQRFENNRIYRADGAFEWDNWAQDQSPMFDGNDAPNPATMEAGWGTYEPNRGYLIGFQ